MLRTSRARRGDAELAAASWGALWGAVFTCCAISCRAQQLGLGLDYQHGGLVPAFAVQAPPTFLFRTDIPAALPATPAAPATPAGSPAVPDHVTPVLRAGQPAILLLPETPTSGTYHLSDSNHRFPPFLENVVNRVQNYFSSYVQIDPLALPFPTPPPPAPESPPLAATPANRSLAAATSPTTTVLAASATNSQTANLRLAGPSHGFGPGDGRNVNLRQVADQGNHQNPHGGGQAGQVDSYLPVDGGHTDTSYTVEERPPPAPAPAPPAPARPDDARYGPPPPPPPYSRPGRTSWASRP